MPVCVAQRLISSSEFADWQLYFEKDKSRTRREEYYFASIQAEIRRGMVKDPSKVDFKDFVISFAPKEEKVNPKTAEEKKEHIKRSKAAWMVFVGAGKDKKKPKKKK